MDQAERYLEEFPVNEEGFLLVNDLALIEALRRRAERQKAVQSTHADEMQLGVKSS